MKKVPMPEDTVGLRAYLEQLRDDYLVRRAAENKTKRPVRTTLPTSVYAGMEDLLLKHGRFYVPQPLPKPYQRGSLRRCFDNAYQSALRSAGRLRYVEGLAVSGETPVHHAWCVDDAGRVIDRTWDPPAIAYFGVVVPLARVKLSRSPRQQCLSFLDDWPNDYKALMEPYVEPKQRSPKRPKKGNR